MDSSDQHRVVYVRVQRGYRGEVSGTASVLTDKYHLTQTRNVNGEFPAGYVPPGNYLVQTYVRPDLKTGKVPKELLRWRMARREMYIGMEAEIILKLSPEN